MTQQGLLSIEMLLAQLEQIRKQHGDEAYEQARRGFAKSVILKNNGDKFVSNAFPDMDLDELRREAEAEQTVATGTPEQTMLAMLRQQVPNIKNQIQFNTFSGQGATTVIVSHNFIIPSKKTLQGTLEPVLERTHLHKIL